MTDQNDTYLSHYPNATHHTTSDTNMSFIEINTKKKQFKLHIYTTVPSYFERHLMKVILSVHDEGYFERT
jgi:hypothetical protein